MALSHPYVHIERPREAVVGMGAGPVREAVVGRFEKQDLRS